MRRLVSAAFVVGVTIAACVGGLRLSSTAQEIVTTNVSPGSDFGAVPLGQTSSPITITIGPAAGTNSDVVDPVKVSCGSDFTVDAPRTPVTVGQDCGGSQASGTASVGTGSGTAVCSKLVTYAITVTFTPHSTVTQSCTITATIDGGNAPDQVINLTGTGKAPPFGATVTPDGIDFGSVRVGDSSNPSAITIQNIGLNDLPVASITVDNPVFGPAGGVNTGVHTIKAGTTEADGFVCTPSGAGNFSGKLTVTFGASAMLAPVTVDVACAGVQTDLSVPSPDSYADTRVGDNAQDLSVVITNKGNMASSIEKVSIATGSTSNVTITSAPGPGAKIQPLATATITLHWDPRVENHGSLGTLQVQHDGGQVDTADIEGNAVVAAMSVTPDGVFDFGAVCVGASGMHAFTVAKTGEGSVTLDSVTVADTSQFHVDPISGPVDPMVMFPVSTSPKASGVQMTTMTVTTDIPGSAPHDVALTVTAFDQGIDAAPTAVEFGGIVIDTVSNEKDVSLSNCGSGAVAVTAATIDPAGDFDLSNVEWMRTLQPTEAASFHLLFTPHQLGVDQATLHITYDGGSADIALSGTGNAEGAGSDGGDGKDSYYACSAGGPVSLVPCAAVWLVVRRRRRRA